MARQGGRKTKGGQKPGLLPSSSCMPCTLLWSVGAHLQKREKKAQVHYLASKVVVREPPRKKKKGEE